MAVNPVLDGHFNTAAPKVGQELSIDLTENVPGTTIILDYGVADDRGNEWVRTLLTSDGATYTTVPTEPGDLVVSCNLMRRYNQTPAPPLVLHTTVAENGVGSGDLLPGQIAGKVIVGLATDNYTARVAETGPVGAEHFFVSSWNVSSFISKAKEIHALGLLPYGNMKTGDWGSAASGSLDSGVDSLGNQLAALGYPVRVVFHHEPGFKTPSGAGEGGTGYEWRAMNIRLNTRLRAIADNVITGVCDNGFKFSPKTSGQGWTDAELNQLYTDEFLDSMDVLGADYYDGATSQTNGEPAALKAARATSYVENRGWDGHMDTGEFQFVKPADAISMFNVAKIDPRRWWCMIAFDSDTNNRTQIPTKGGGWNFTHDFSTDGDRLDAFKAIMADPISFP